MWEEQAISSSKGVCITWRQSPVVVKLTMQTLGYHSATVLLEWNAVEAIRTCRQIVGGTGHKLNSQKRVCFAGRCLLATLLRELEPSYTLIEQGCWKSLY